LHLCALNKETYFKVKKHCIESKGGKFKAFKKWKVEYTIILYISLRIWDQIENNFWNYPIFKDNDQSSTTAKKPEQSSSFLTNSPKDVTDEEVTTIQNLPKGQLIL
jgi:hypothetical protein